MHGPKKQNEQYGKVFLLSHTNLVFIEMQGGNKHVVFGKPSKLPLFNHETSASAIA